MKKKLQAAAITIVVLVTVATVFFAVKSMIDMRNLTNLAFGID